MGTVSDRNVYAGIFADETGQQLLLHSMAQLQSTLGTAWTACAPKENRLDVFAKCMDLVDTWNDRTFAEEAATFSQRPRAPECWRDAFVGYVRQVYRGGKTQVRATVPSEAAYVQALLSNAAKYRGVRSGRYFECDSSLERKDMAMEIIRMAVVGLCTEFVLEEPKQWAETPVADVSPDDSASQVGVRAYQSSGDRADRDRRSDRGSEVREAKRDYRSVTVATDAEHRHESRDPPLPKHDSRGESDTSR